MTRGKRRALAAVVIAAALVVPLAGCDSSPGVVTGRYTTRSRGHTNYWVTVRHDSGKTTTELVLSGHFWSCSTGSRWPDCSK